MASYSVATTKDQLSRLIDLALAGERVVITRHGKPTVEMKVVTTAPEPSRADIYQEIEVLRAALPVSPEPAADLIRRLRDEGV